MKIIGAGFGRTGTTSLRAALNHLGFGPTYHMIEVFKNPSHVGMWQAIADGEPVDWQHLFRKYQSTLDYPASLYYKELLQAYPDARVLLTVRDPIRWHDSTLNTIFITTSLPRRLLTLLPPLGRFARMVDATVWDGYFDGRFADRDHAISLFERHIEEVKAAVPPDRLLIFDVKQGWEPLCEFLGVPVPDRPFPHLNDRRQFVWLRRFLRTLPILVGAALIGLPLLIICFVIRALS